MFAANRFLTSGYRILGLGVVAVSNKTLASTGSVSVMGCSSSSNNDLWRSANTIYDFTVKDINGNEVNLKERYEGKVVLVVNVASR